MNNKDRMQYIQAGILDMSLPTLTATCRVLGIHTDRGVKYMLEMLQGKTPTEILAAIFKANVIQR